MGKQVTIADYDPQWVQQFEQERLRILAALGEGVQDLQHIGITSIPGLAA